MTTESTEFPAPTESPVAFLQAITQSAPSQQCLQLLSGDIVSVLKQSTNLSAPYLYAVAQHLPTENLAISSAASSTAGISAASHQACSPQHISTILDALGFAVSQCQPRAEIIKSGILSVLAQQLPAASSFSLYHVEFLQACIFAEQYSFAESHVSGAWPRPTASVCVTHVLRYYYLRGCVHMACGNRRLSVRCFWTCLSVPGDIVSAIQVAAWKKMVLVQCLRLSEQGHSSETIDPLAFPKAAPGCLNRLINLALCMQQPNAPNEPEDDPETVHMVESTTPIGDEQDPLEADATESVNRKSQAMTMAVYGQLAKDFVNVDRSAVDRLVSDKRDVFLNDGNFGMVQQVQQALVRRQIYQLSSIYSVIPLQRLAEMLRIEEGAARNLLVKLAVDHAWEIGIQVSDEGTMIVTLPPFPQNDVNSSVPEMMELASLVRDLDVSIATSSKYSSRVRKENSKNSREMSSKQIPKGIEEL